MQIEYEGPTTLRANQLFTAALRITLEETLNAGACIVLAARHMSDLGDPQLDTPWAKSYISVAGPGNWKLGAAKAVRQRAMVHLRGKRVSI